MVHKTDTWTKTPTLAQKSETQCHFFGLGKFKVMVKSGGRTSTYNIDSPAEYMPVSFARLLAAGEAEIMVQNVADARYAKPIFVGLLATTDASYAPDLLDLKYPFFARFRNLANENAFIDASGVSQSEFVGSYYLGLVSANGFCAPSVLRPNESSRLISLSRKLTARTVFWFKLMNGTANTAVDIEFYTDPVGVNLIKTLHFRGNATTNKIIVVYPQADNTLTCAAPVDIFKNGLALLDEAARKDPSFRRPLPSKAYVSTSVSDVGEDMETFAAELDLVRRTGSNSVYSTIGRMNERRDALGFKYGWDMAINFIPIPADFRFDANATAEYAKRAHSSGTVPRATAIMLTDEPIFREIEKNAALDTRLRAWMQQQGMKPADAGCATWDDVKVIAPSPANKRLSVVSRAFQVAQYSECFNGFASAYTAISPNFKPAVNWGMMEYMDGLNMDLWEMYRQPGYGYVWAEDWYGYEPLGAGAIAWYADLMRSQQKYRNLPAGTYPIVGWGYAAATTEMKYYERMMRGCSTFETYAYSPRGNQVSWIEQPAVVLTLSRLHRDLAAVEDILVGGKVVNAKVALLYPNSSMLWDPLAARDIQAIYTACLQAGIAVDVLTEQDLVDGYAKSYKVVMAAGINIRPDALKALDSFMQAGGTVAWSAPDVRDQFDEPIPGAAEIFGAKSLTSEANNSPGRWLYDLPKMKPLDTVKWDGKEIGAYCQKAKLEPLPTSEVLATFAGGSPALIKARRGKGTAYLYGFAPGLSYMKADYGENNNILATVLCANDNERALATLPARGADTTVQVNRPMVSARAVVNGDAAFVGLVDYGLGVVGRKTKNPDQRSIDFSTMEPYAVSVAIACKSKPRQIYGVRSGNLSWKFQNGVAQVEVPLRGVEMIVLQGTRLAE